jgi:hypothetical protein
MVFLRWRGQLWLQSPVTNISMYCVSISFQELLECNLVCPSAIFHNSAKYWHPPPTLTAVSMLNSDCCVPELMFVCFTWFLYITTIIFNTEFVVSFLPVDITYSSMFCLLGSRQQNLFDIYLLLYVQSWTPADGRKDRPKHVECYSRINKCEKLVHIVGFTVETFMCLNNCLSLMMTF